MADIKESIKFIDIGDGKQHPIDAVTVGGKSASELQEYRIVQEINATSDDVHYPSAACVYNALGDIESLLSKI